MKNFSIGDTVYFIEKWTGNVLRGKVSKIYDDGVSATCEWIVDAEGNSIDESFGTSGARFEDLYATAQEAFDGKNRKHLEQVSKYCDGIIDVESLLKFALNHCLNGAEYTDDEAREAYIRKAKELLNIDLEHDTELELD